MADMPGWKRALQEPNAIGWIAFLVLMLVIGFVSLYFGNGGQKQAEAPAKVNHAAHQ